jgi:phospholipase/carboxylesterase
MQVELTELGGLKCRVVGDTDSQPELAVILSHGYGAPGTDLAPLGAELFQLEPKLEGRVRFYFPEAPLSLAAQGMPGGRAWWHLDVTRLMMAAELGDFSSYRNQVPAGIEQAREHLLRTVGEIRTATGLPTSRIVLGGFSQGSMLSTDVSLRLSEAPAALCVLSGTLLCEAEWRELAAKRGPLRVLQSHGYQDQILPYSSAEWLRDLFLEAGFKVEFVPFAGGHTISYEVLHKLAALLGQLVEA